MQFITIQLILYIINTQQKIYESTENMFHNSSDVVSFKTIPENQLLELPTRIKFRAGYIHLPNINQPISSKPQIGRYVFPTQLQNPLNNQYIITNPGKKGTMKILDLKKYSQQSTMFIRRHIRGNLKSYFKRKYLKPTYLLPLQEFECLRLNRIVQEKKKGGQKKREEIKDEDYNYSTKTLYVYKTYYDKNLKDYLDDIANGKEAGDFLEKNHYKIANGLIVSVLEAGGTDNMFITTSNVYFGKNLQINLNYTSICGILFVNTREPITKKQLYQIYPYLTQYVFKNGTSSFSQKSGKTQEQIKENRKELINFKIRGILINMLSVLLKRDIYFDIKLIQNGKEISLRQMKQKKIEWESVYNCIKIIPDHFQKLLNTKQAKMGILQMEMFLKKQQCMKATSVQRSLLSLFQDVLVKNKQTTYEELLSFFTKKLQKPSQSLFKQKMEKIHEMFFSREPKKQFYRSRGIDSVALYIPIKYGLDLNLLFMREMWWQILLGADIDCIQPNFMYCLMMHILYYDKKDSDIGSLMKHFGFQQLLPQSQFKIEEEELTAIRQLMNKIYSSWKKTQVVFRGPQPQQNQEVQSFISNLIG